MRFDRKTSNPCKVTIELTIHEAAYLAKLVGCLPTDKLEGVVAGCEEISHEIYQCLTGDLFNRYWDEGINGAIKEILP